MSGDLAQTGAFPSFTHLPGALDSGALFLCDHASAALPPELGDLGLSPDHFTRHIAYDIGAAWLTRALAARLCAPALLTTYSRLLIDPNRGGDDPTLVMRISDRAVIPGNAHIDEAEVARRRRDPGADLDPFLHTGLARDATPLARRRPVGLRRPARRALHGVPAGAGP